MHSQSPQEPGTNVRTFPRRNKSSEPPRGKSGRPQRRTSRTNSTRPAPHTLHTQTTCITPPSNLTPTPTTTPTTTTTNTSTLPHALHTHHRRSTSNDAVYRNKLPHPVHAFSITNTNHSSRSHSTPRFKHLALCNVDEPCSSSFRTFAKSMPNRHRCHPSRHPRSRQPALSHARAPRPHYQAPSYDRSTDTS